MDEELPKAAARYCLGDDLSRLSVVELKALHATLMEEAARILAEMEAKAATRSAADSFFKPKD